MSPGVTAINVGFQYAHKLRLVDLVNPFHLLVELVGHYNGVVILALFAHDFHLALERYPPDSKGKVVVAP